MVWVKLDDLYPRHLKMLAAGVHGFALDVAAMCWAAHHRTDGFIPDYAIGDLFTPLRNPRKVAERLVACGRWERTDDGWTIHDWLDYNPSRVEVEEKAAARAAAGAVGGIRSGESRREAKREANASANGEANSEAKPEVNANPVPVTPVVPTELLDQEEGRNGDGHPNGDNPDNLPLRAAEGQTYTATVVAWAVTKGQPPPPTKPPLARYLFALDTIVAYGHNDSPAYRARLLRVVCDYAEHVKGERYSRGQQEQLRRLLASREPRGLLRSLAEALDRGAGLHGEHAGDPRAELNYALAMMVGGGSRGGA